MKDDGPTSLIGYVAGGILGWLDRHEHTIKDILFSFVMVALLVYTIITLNRYSELERYPPWRKFKKGAG